MGVGQGGRPDHERLALTVGLANLRWNLLAHWLRLGLEALATGWAFRRRGWWRKSPFLPLPDPFYLRWRVHTAYGGQVKAISRADLISFLGWRIQFFRYVKATAS